jgi:hypothetical protein
LTQSAETLRKSDFRTGSAGQFAHTDGASLAARPAAKKAPNFRHADAATPSFTLNEKNAQ